MCKGNHKKVVYMITTAFYPSIGGLENHVYNLSKELVGFGIKVKIIHPVINNQKNNVYNLDGIEVHDISIGNEKDEKSYENYKKISKGNVIGFYNGYKRKYFFNKFCKEIYEYITSDINDEKPNKVIIHQHDFISSIKLSKKLSKEFNVIFTNHTGEFLFLKKLPFSNYIIKCLTKHFKFIIAPSNELAEFKGIRNENTYMFLSNGVDTKRFDTVSEKEKLNLRKLNNLDMKKKIVFCPRRWAPTKGIIYLVKAIDDLVNNKKVKDLLFVFAGNEYSDYPEYKKAVNKIIEEKKLSDYIVLEGNVNYAYMDKLVKLSDFIVIPSLMEAISLTALEGMACGKIIIGTNVGGFPQIIKNNENGFLVEASNAQELSNLIYKLDLSLEKYKHIEKNSREFVEKKYSWKYICKKTMEVYDRHWSFISI